MSGSDPFPRDDLSVLNLDVATTRLPDDANGEVVATVVVELKDVTNPQADVDVYQNTFSLSELESGVDFQPPNPPVPPRYVLPDPDVQVTGRAAGGGTSVVRAVAATDAAESADVEGSIDKVTGKTTTSWGPTIGFEIDGQGAKSETEGFSPLSAFAGASLPIPYIPEVVSTSISGFYGPFTEKTHNYTSGDDSYAVLYKAGDRIEAKVTAFEQEDAFGIPGLDMAVDLFFFIAHETEIDYKADSTTDPLGYSGFSETTNIGAGVNPELSFSLPRKIPGQPLDLPAGSLLQAKVSMTYYGAYVLEKSYDVAEGKNPDPYVTLHVDDVPSSQCTSEAQAANVCTCSNGQCTYVASMANKGHMGFTFPGLDAIGDMWRPGYLISTIEDPNNYESAEVTNSLQFGMSLEGEVGVAFNLFGGKVGAEGNVTVALDSSEASGTISGSASARIVAVTVSVSIEWSVKYEDDDENNAVSDESLAGNERIVVEYSPLDGDPTNFSSNGWQLLSDDDGGIDSDLLHDARPVIVDLLWDDGNQQNAGAVTVWESHHSGEGSDGNAVLAVTSSMQTPGESDQTDDLGSLSAGAGANVGPAAAFDWDDSQAFVAWTQFPTTGVDSWSDYQDVLDAVQQSELYYAVLDTVNNQPAANDEPPTFQSLGSPARVTTGDDGVPRAPALGYGHDGTMRLAWIGEEDNSFANLYVSEWNGNSWSAPVTLDSGAYNVTELVVSSFGDKAAVYWTEDFPNSYSGAVLFDDPLVYYRMNDTDAQGGYDSVETATNLGTLGSSYDGSYVHCCSHEQLGAPGALLPGDDDPSIRFEAKAWDDPPNVQIADSDKLLGNGSYSVEAWVNFSGAPQTPVFVSIIDKGWKSDLPTKTDDWYLGTEGLTPHALVFDAGSGKISYPLSSASYGSWHHVVATFNAQTNLAALYVDGELAGSKTGSPYAPTDNAISIGGRHVSGLDGGNFYGSIDEVAIYGRALTVDEIQRHYRSAPKDDGANVSRAFYSVYDLGGDGRWSVPIRMDIRPKVQPTYQATPSQAELTSLELADAGFSLTFPGSTTAGLGLVAGQFNACPAHTTLVGGRCVATDGICPNGYEVGGGGCRASDPLCPENMVYILPILSKPAGCYYDPCQTVENQGHNDGPWFIADTPNYRGWKCMSRSLGSGTYCKVGQIDWTYYYCYADPTPYQEGEDCPGGASWDPDAGPIVFNQFSSGNKGGCWVPTNGPCPPGGLPIPGSRYCYAQPHCPAGTKLLNNNCVADAQGVQNSIVVGDPGAGAAYVIRGGADPDVVASLQFTPDMQPQDEIAIVLGPAAERFGETLVVGDFDADGAQDLAVAAPGGDTVYVLESQLLVEADTVIDLNQPSTYESDHQLRVLTLPAGSRAGEAMVTGDFDGDGDSDLVIGAPRYTDASGTFGGLFFVGGGSDFFQTATTTLPTPFFTRDCQDKEGCKGPQVGQGLGTALGVSPGTGGNASLNNDDIDDLLVGAPLKKQTLYFWINEEGKTVDKSKQSRDIEAGGAYVLMGQEDFGSGRETLVLTIDTEPYLFLGGQPVESSEGQPFPATDATEGLVNRASSWHTGTSVADVGDVNGDGINDVAIGSPGIHTGQGAVFVVYGWEDWPREDNQKTSIDELNLFADTSGSFRDNEGAAGSYVSVVTGSQAYGMSGSHLSRAGNFDGAGGDDVLLTSPSAGYSAGRTEIVFQGFYPGESYTLDLTDGSDRFTFNGSNPQDWSGARALGGTNLNGDTDDDMIIAAPAAGKVYVVYGHDYYANGGHLDLGTLRPSQGFVLVEGVVDDGVIHGVGDVNGDGFDDVLVDNVLIPGGSSEAMLLSAPLDSIALEGDSPSSGLGDVDGDGFDDVITNTLLGQGVTHGGSDLHDLTSKTITSGAGHYKVMTGIGDFDGDGLGDLLGGYLSKVKLWVVSGTHLQGGGSYVFPVTHSPTVATGLEAPIVAGGIGDVNGDGYADFVYGSPNGDANLIYGNADGDGSHTGSYGTVGSQVGTAGDFFGLGYDIWLAVTDSAVNLYADGKSGHRPIQLTGSPKWAAGVGDTNADGYDDVLISDGDGLYLVFGGAYSPYPWSTSLSSLPQASDTGQSSGRGFQFEGIGGVDNLPSPAGDFNGDGFMDYAIAYTGQDNGGVFVVFGDDFTGSVDLPGTIGNDALVGTSADEVITGGVGEDYLQSGGGADVLYGGHGDDFLVVDDHSFRRLDGGRGFDTLVTGHAADLTDFVANFVDVENFEAWDLSDFGEQSLTLSTDNFLTVAAIASGNVLIVKGDATDSVTVTGSSIQNKGLVTASDGNVYQSLEYGNRYLYVEPHLLSFN